MSIILETKRLILRNLKEADIDILYIYRNDDICAKYQSWTDSSYVYLKNLIENNKDKTINKETLQIAIALKSDDTIIGDMYICFKDKTITLGYTIQPKEQRKGYAYEALTNIINYLHERFKEYEIVCMVHPDNEASKRLLEKMKFKNEGYAKPVDSIIYSIYSIN